MIKNSFKKYLSDFVFFFIFIIFPLLCFKSSIVEPYRIPSGSMLPTLKIGDFILVNKMAYELRIPFSSRFNFTNMSWKINKIRRGDIIVFKFPKDPKVNYIKRVLALPGERVMIKNKKIFINGKPLRSSEVKYNYLEEGESSKYRDNNFKHFKVRLRKGKDFIYQIDEDNYFKVDYKEKVVPEGHYFVLGDNRDFSYDSRYWGMVPATKVEGRAFYRWLSIGKKEKRGRYQYFFRKNRIGEMN